MCVNLTQNDDTKNKETQNNSRGMCQKIHSQPVDKNCNSIEVGKTERNKEREGRERDRDRDRDRERNREKKKKENKRT